MGKIFDFGGHPGRKDTTKLTADVMIPTPTNPAFKTMNVSDEVMKILHRVNQKNRQKLAGGNPTGIDQSPATDDSNDTERNEPAKPASRSASLAQRQLKPGSRLPPLDGAKFMEANLARLLLKRKSKRKKIRLPVNMSGSDAVFPQQTEMLHESVEQRMTAARDMLHHLNRMGKYNVDRKVETIIRSIREVRKPILEQQQVEWDLARLDRQREEERMRHNILKEDIGKGLLGFAGFVAKRAAQDAVGNDLVGAASAAIRGFKKKPSLRSIVPKQKTTQQSTHTAMDIDAGRPSGVLTKVSGLPCPFGLVRPLTGIFLPGSRLFARAEIHPTFFKLYQGRNEAKMIMQAKIFSAMGVWTSLEPQLTTPTTSPSLQGGGEPRVRGPV